MTSKNDQGVQGTTSMHPWLLLLRSDGRIELLPGPRVRLYLRDIIQIAVVAFVFGWWIA